MGIVTVYAYTDTSMQTALGSFDPSSLTWGLQDISDAATGRTQTGKMVINRVAQKVKLSLAFNGVTLATASQILTAFNPTDASNPYLRVKDPAPKSGATVGKVFYIGDRSAPVYMYTQNKKIYQNIAFDLIEV